MLLYKTCLAVMNGLRCPVCWSNLSHQQQCRVYAHKLVIWSAIIPFIYYFYAFLCVLNTGRSFECLYEFMKRVCREIFRTVLCYSTVIILDDVFRRSFILLIFFFMFEFSLRNADGIGFKVKLKQSLS